MNAVAMTGLLLFLAASSLTTCAWRTLRYSRRPVPSPESCSDWPPVMRPFLASAAWLAAKIQGYLPTWYAERTSRRLRKADMAAAATAAVWAGLCVSMAIPAGFFCALLAAALRSSPGVAGIAAAMLAWVFCERWLQQRISALERRVVRDLPTCLDLLTLCVEAGATLTAAARYIVDQSPQGPLRSYFDRVLREIRSGRARAQAFIGVAESLGIESLCSLASALAHAEASGMSIGQVLRTQAEQRSAERFVRAERQAMQAPVKMLGPLILCIFPCTFIVLALPIAWRLQEALHS